jgi:broad specificity phosphatase PhoE
MKPMVLPAIYLARHGETAWSLTGQHTGLTDLPLTERGEQNARRLGERLAGLTFAKVFTSPLRRAARTCELAGFGTAAEIDRDLVEWNYGDCVEYGQRELRQIRCSNLLGAGERSSDRSLPVPGGQLLYGTRWFDQ